MALNINIPGTEPLSIPEFFTYDAGASGTGIGRIVGNQIVTTDPDILGTMLLQQEGIDPRNVSRADRMTRGMEYIEGLGLDLSGAQSISGAQYADLLTHLDRYGDQLGLTRSSDVSLFSTPLGGADQTISAQISQTNPNAFDFTSDTRGTLSEATLSPLAQQAAALGVTETPGTAPPIGTLSDQTNTTGQVGLLPAGMTVPTSVDQVTSTPPLSFPTGTPSTGNTTNAIAGATGINSLIESLTKSTESYKESAADLQKENEGILAKILGQTRDTAQTRQNFFDQIGVSPEEYFAESKAIIAEINTLNEQYNNIVAARDAQIAESYDNLSTTNFINNRIAQINRNAAPELNRISANINAKAATLQAVQGRFNEARSFVEQAVRDVTADREFEYRQLATLYDANQDAINSLDKKYQNAFNQAISIARDEYERAYRESTAVGNLMVENPNAGITISDSLQTAQQKLSLYNQSAGSGLTSEFVGGFEILRDAQGNVVKSRVAGGGDGGGSTTDTAPIDLLQKELNEGKTPEKAARDAAYYYDKTLGIPINTSIISQWTEAARALTPDTSQAEEERRFLGNIVDSLKNWWTQITN